MSKYQTAEQMMLDYLYKETKEELQASVGVMNALLKDKDRESWIIETNNYKALQNKLAKISWLIGFESSSCTSYPASIVIEYGCKHGEVLIAERIK